LVELEPPDPPELEVEELEAGVDEPPVEAAAELLPASDLLSDLLSDFPVSALAVDDESDLDESDFESDFESLLELE
jgi:hypothetical protein